MSGGSVKGIRRGINRNAVGFFKRFFGRGLFPERDIEPEQDEIRLAYRKVFNHNSENVKIVLFDLAKRSGFLNPNADNDAVREGKRSLFLEILALTNDPRDVRQAELEEGMRENLEKLTGHKL